MRMSWKAGWVTARGPVIYHHRPRKPPGCSVAPQRFGNRSLSSRQGGMVSWAGPNLRGAGTTRGLASFGAQQGCRCARPAQRPIPSR